MSRSALSRSDEGSTALCEYGTKLHWDAMYQGKEARPAEAYSWYCGWDELEVRGHERTNKTLLHSLAIDQYQRSHVTSTPTPTPNARAAVLREMVPDETAKVLVPGAGNDPTVPNLYGAPQPDILQHI